MKQILPEAGNRGHYVPGMMVGNTLYISGQLPADPKTGKLTEGGIVEQTRTALGNMERVLLAAGMTRENVALCRVYIPDASLWDTVNDVYAQFFGSHRPARVIVPTSGLHYGALVEIEAVAEREEAE